MLFIVNLLIKTDSTFICVPCMLEHVCYEPFSLKIILKNNGLLSFVPLKFFPAESQNILAFSWKKI